MILKIDPKRPDRRYISYGAKVIRDGGLVAFPTETVYGLAANLKDAKAIDRLYEVKNRPRAKQLTIHISSLGMIRKMGCPLTKETKALIEKFWPGPLTIILKAKDGNKIGFRMPDNKSALDLIKRSGVPVVAPSANISGKEPPRSARQVLKELNGKIDIVLDGGRTIVGVESTVIDLTVKPPKVLREGAIKKKELKGVL